MSLHMGMMNQYPDSYLAHICITTNRSEPKADSDITMTRYRISTTMMTMQ